MTEEKFTIGFREEWKAFLNKHPSWPEKYKQLTSTLTKTFIREVETKTPADKVVFYLGRLCVEDFNEIFLLCGNGYGIGGLKILRGLYERAVTLGYIAEHPNEAEQFLDYHHIHQGKMIIHAEKNFDIKNQIDPNDYCTIKDNYKKYKEKYQQTSCKECRTTRTMFSWSKLDTAAMANKVQLDGLYFPAFFYPTLHTHATPTSLLERLKFREDGAISFDEGAQHVWASKALIAAHNLMLRVLMTQNTYFDLKIDNEIDERNLDFKEMWSDNDAQ